MSSVPPKASSSSSATPAEAVAVEEQQPPQPGTSSEAGGLDLVNDDDPKPGPSTTAADFDLEVFDSGSSCSLEDCWGCGIPAKAGLRPSKGRKKTSEAVVHSTESSENESYDDITTVMSVSPSEAVESACPSETEEAEDEEDDATKEADDCDDDHCQCPKSLIALPPLRLTDAVASNASCWKCAGPSTSTASMTLCTNHAAENTENIDEIVQDHDTFGTDENDDDSLDSTAMQVSLNDADMMQLPASKIGGGFKRKSADDEMTSSRYASEAAFMVKKKREHFLTSEQEVCCQMVCDSSPKVEARLREVPEVEPLHRVETPKELNPWLDMFSTWSHAQRLIAIDQLIGNCHPTQVYCLN
jgi:hypothetical protein